MATVMMSVLQESGNGVVDVCWLFWLSSMLFTMLLPLVGHSMLINGKAGATFLSVNAVGCCIMWFWRSLAPHVYSMSEAEEGSSYGRYAVNTGTAALCMMATATTATCSMALNVSLQTYTALQLMGKYTLAAACSGSSSMYSMLVSEGVRSYLKHAVNSGSAVLCKAATAFSCHHNECAAPQV